MQNPKLNTRKISAVPVSRRGLNRVHGTEIEVRSSNVRPTEENAFEENRTRNGGPPVWYCLRSRRNQECVAAARLKASTKIQVFSPQIRFRSHLNGSNRSSLVTEPLFPGYFFARSCWTELLAAAERVPDVWGIVSCDEKPAVIEEGLIETLRAKTAAAMKGFTPGESVRLTDGRVSGIQAVITRILSGSERVRAFLDFLASGRSAENAATSQSESLVLRLSTRFTVTDSGRTLPPCAFEEPSLAELNLSLVSQDVMRSSSILSSLRMDGQIAAAAPR
jgi:transcriptional antiterminator RfaH